MRRAASVLVVVMLLGACRASAPEDTPTPVPEATSVPGITPVPISVPTSVELTEADFVEPVRRQIYLEVVDSAGGGISGSEDARAAVAKRWGISLEAMDEIVAEGLEKTWFMATPTVTVPVSPAPTLPTTPVSPTAVPTQTPDLRRTAATAVEALDGDTIQVDLSGASHLVCYAGIEAPEAATPVGGRAAQANRRLVKGQTVYLERDVLDADQAGCLLRHVFLEDGSLASATLVSYGYAEVLTESPNARYRSLLLEVQQEAQRIGWGMWEVPPTATPKPAVTAVTVTVTPTLESVSPTPTPTATSAPAATSTSTATAVLPTPTPTPSATATLVPPTATPTETATPVPPTSTSTETATPVPPTLTPTPTETLTGLVVDVTAWVV
jgi:endonuclease YncB( thermonuclease family)